MFILFFLVSTGRKCLSYLLFGLFWLICVDTVGLHLVSKAKQTIKSRSEVDCDVTQLSDLKPITLCVKGTLDHANLQFAKINWFLMFSLKMREQNYQNKS